MPPRVLILVLITTVPPGTKKGIQQHSPVLVATLQTVHGRQKYPRIPACVRTFIKLYGRHVASEGGGQGGPTFSRSNKFT